MRFINKYSACIYILLISGSISAQVNDAGLWLTVSAEKKLTQAFSVKLSEELRFNENVSELGTYFTEAGLTYKIRPSIGITAAFRYINKRNLDDSYTSRYRYLIDADYKFDFRKITIGIKGRFQSQFSDELFITADQLLPVNYARGKLTLKYNLEKRYKPFITGEVFYQLNNPEGNEIDNLRFSAGFDYELNKYSSLKLYYMYQQEINVNKPRTDYISGIGYELSF
jgi:hypothetical protein